LRQRYNDLETERQTLLATITGLDDRDVEEPDRPDASQLDVLPHLTVNLHRVPEDLLDRLFDLTQLTIQVHYASNERP
jgi:site-specific DNA recombinase